MFEKRGVFLCLFSNSVERSLVICVCTSFTNFGEWSDQWFFIIISSILYCQFSCFLLWLCVAVPPLAMCQFECLMCSCVLYSLAINGTAAVVSWAASDLTQLSVTCPLCVHTRVCCVDLLIYLCLHMLYLAYLDEALYCPGRCSLCNSQLQI